MEPRCPTPTNSGVLGHMPRSPFPAVTGPPRHKRGPRGKAPSQSVSASSSVQEVIPHLTGLRSECAH